MPENPLDIQHGGTHYKDLAIQPAEYCQRNNLPFCESSAIKYITRHASKNGIEDIKKAIHFLQMLLDFTYQTKCEVTYPETNKPKPLCNYCENIAAHFPYDCLELCDYCHEEYKNGVTLTRENLSPKTSKSNIDNAECSKTDYLVTKCKLCLREDIRLYRLGDEILCYICCKKTKSKTAKVPYESTKPTI